MSTKDHPDTSAWKQWEAFYRFTRLSKFSEEAGERTWHFQTGNRNIAERLKRKVGFRPFGVPQRGYPPIWMFLTEYSSRGNAIRSMSRIVRTPCEWDPKRKEIVASNPKEEN